MNGINLTEMLIDQLRLVRLVRSLLGDPRRWTKRWTAVDDKGNLVFSTDPSACKWCLIGAVTKVITDRPELGDASRQVMWDMSAFMTGRGADITTGWFLRQDEPDFTHADLIALLDKLERYYDPNGDYTPLDDVLVSVKDKEV